MTVCLFVIMGGRIASAVTILDNGISKFVLNNYGVVTEAYYLLGNSATNLLDADQAKGFNFGMYSPDITSTNNTIWMDEMITAVTQVAPNEYRFSGTNPFSMGGTPISLSYMVNVKLQPGKPYLDLRYDIQVSASASPKVAYYFYMETKDRLSLRASNETAGASNWEMVNNIASSWFGSANWPQPPLSQTVFTGGGVLGLAIKKDDDAFGGEACDVWNWANHIFEYLYSLEGYK